MSYRKFKLTDLVDQGVQDDNMVRIRRALTSVCEFDRTFTDGRFEDGLKYVLEVKGIPKEKLYEKFDPDLSPLFRDRVDRKDRTLTAQDFSLALSWLTENFCEERIEDTKKLGRYLFPDEVRTPETQLHQQGGGRRMGPTRRSPQRKNAVRLLIVLGSAAVVVTATVLIAKTVERGRAGQVREPIGEMDQLICLVESLTNQVEQLTYQVEDIQKKLV